MTRIVVVDDHPVFRKGLVALLRAEGHDVVGEASSGPEAVSIAKAERPEVVLMDLAMPNGDGFDATSQITASLPDTKVVVISLFEDQTSVVRALEAGASGYVSKQADPDQITGAIDAALRGAMWLGSGISRLPLNSSAAPLPGMTPRESEIAELLSRGLSNQLIAKQLFLSAKTVANYVSLILLKLGAADREDAARKIRAARQK